MSYVAKRGSLSHWLAVSQPWNNSTEPCHSSSAGTQPQRTSPECYDIAIIGAGITGCALAYHLRTLQPELKVAVIEARGISEGATGRNGGLMWPSLNAPWPITVAQYGQAAAQNLMQFEQHAFQDILGFIQDHKLEEQLQFSLFPDGGYILAETQDELDLEVADLAAQQQVGVTPLVTLLTPEDVTHRLGPHHFVGGLHQEKVAQVTAVRLAHALLHMASQVQPAQSLTIMQHARVTAISRTHGSPGAAELFHLTVQSEDSGTVQTSHASSRSNSAVLCRKVVHCTNGYNHLLPQLIKREWLVPVRNQVAVTPKLPADHPMPHAAFYARTGYVYFSRRLNDHMVIGGFRHVTPHMEWGTTDDSQTGLDTHVSDQLRRYLPTTFPHLFTDSKDTAAAARTPATASNPLPHTPSTRSNPQQQQQQAMLIASPARGPGQSHSSASTPFSVTYELEWSGILGFTKDRWPLVGMLPAALCAAAPTGSPAAAGGSSTNEFCCMGFSGHGMTRAFTCARNTAYMLLGKPLEPSFPARIFSPDRVLAADTPTVPSLPHTRHAAATTSKL